jgi:hypothetical protein
VKLNMSGRARPSVISLDVAIQSNPRNSTQN